MIVGYKIKRLSDGLYSKGGGDPAWNKTGKLWKKRGHLSTHLFYVNSRLYEDCVVVLVEGEETEIADLLEALYAGVTDRAEKRDELWKSWQDKLNTHDELKEYKRLRKKYGDVT